MANLNNRKNDDELYLDSEYILFKEIFESIISKRFLILKFLFVANLAVFIINFFLPNTYISSTTLKPAQQSSNSFQTFNEIAAISGISIPITNNEDNTLLALEIIRSKSFLMDLIANRQILPYLFAVKGIDKKNQKLIFNQNIYDQVSNEWVRNKQPSIFEAHKKFLSSLTIDHNLSSQFIVISFEHKSPLVAKEILEWIIRDVNHRIAYLRIQEAEASINFIKQEIENTPFNELKTHLYKLIQEHTSTIIVAKTIPEYALSTIDPPIIPEDPNRPAMLLILLITSIASFLFAITFILVNLKLKK